MSTGIVTRRKSAMHIDNSYGIDVVAAANTNLVSKRVLKGEPFSTQIVCDEGYSIYEITIKMGGVDITSTAYDPTYNMISIPSVTDDVDIECYAMHTMPSDYIRVDGIKNPSNAFMSTEYRMPAHSIAFVDCTRGNNNSSDVGIFNSRPGGVTGTRSGGITFNSGVISVGAWPDSATYFGYASIGVTPAVGARFTVTLDKQNGKVLYNNVVKRTFTPNDTSARDASPMTLFALEKWSYGHPENSAGYIIHFASIKEENAYVRYYIPCLNDSGVAGFWDAARGVFQGSSNSTAFRPVYVQDNLIAHYDGIDNAGVGVHDASATTWKDLKGNYDATTDSAITWDSNGVTNNSNRRLFKASPNIIRTISPVDFTIECVFKPTNITSGGVRPTLVSNYNGASNINRLHVNIRTDAFVVFNSSTSVQTPSGLLDNGNSYTVTIRRAGNTCAIFVNGVKATEKNIGYLRFTSNDEYYEIGSYFSTSYAFKGTYYAHRVYTKALTDEEIKGNYNIDKLRFNF